MAKVFLAVGTAIDLGHLSNLTNTARKISDSSCFIASNEKRGMLDFWNNVSGEAQIQLQKSIGPFKVGNLSSPIYKIAHTGINVSAINVSTTF